MADEELFVAVESLMREWRLEEATVLLERRLALPSVPTRIWHDLSILYAQQGLFEIALDCIEKAMAEDPLSRAVWHHYLALQKNNPAQPGDAAWRSMHLRFGDTLRESFDARHLSIPRARDRDARLRIGYLGPDTHSATERFVGPVLSRFDRGKFEVAAYWNHARSLANASRYPDVQHRSIAGKSTQDIVEMVMRDRIDILVDVAGHGAGNALPVLAQRPAPVQLTWLDYLATTGLETVDYRVTDELADPPGAESRHVEELLRLPVPQWCYTPPLDTPLPARREGPIVFGSISVPLKLSAPLLELWARLLSSVPGSRLRFLGVPEGRARERIESAFERAGIARERLDIRGRLPLAEFFAELSRIDIVLDTFPFSGATATLDALWQGAAAVSLAGRLSHARSGASILTALGRPQWVARDEEEYVQIAEALARECAKGAFDRTRMREELRASPLCDAGRFVGALESAYRTSWTEWLRRTQSMATAREHANSRADVLLAASGDDAGRCRALLETLPSHGVTGKIFWSEFRAAGDDPPDARRVALHEIADIVSIEAWRSEARVEGDRDWIGIAADARSAAAARHVTLPREAIGDCDALARFGADGMPHGSLLAAGRGHVGGIHAYAEGESIRVQLWVPHRMRECVVLGGDLILVKRALVEVRRFPCEGVGTGEDFSDAVSRYTYELHRGGARLGIAAALAIPSERSRDPGEQFASDKRLGTACGTDQIAQAGVAASALKAVVPAAAWPAFARRAERFCDFHSSRAQVALSCA